jgi:hypothetical protein
MFDPNIILQTISQVIAALFQLPSDPKTIISNIMGITATFFAFFSVIAALIFQSLTKIRDQLNTKDQPIIREFNNKYGKRVKKWNIFKLKTLKNDIWEYIKTNNPKMLLYLEYKIQITYLKDVFRELAVMVAFFEILNAYIMFTPLDVFNNLVWTLYIYFVYLVSRLIYVSYIIFANMVSLQGDADDND